MWCALMTDVFEPDPPRLRVVGRVPLRVERHGRAGGLVGVEHTCHRPLLGDMPVVRDALLAGHTPPVAVVAPPTAVTAVRAAGATTSPGRVLYDQSNEDGNI